MSAAPTSSVLSGSDGDWSYGADSGPDPTDPNANYDSGTTATPDTTDPVSDAAQVMQSQLQSQLGRPLTPNEILQTIDQARQNAGLASVYSAPLPGVTAEFLSALKSFSANVIQRVSLSPNNSLAAKVASNDLSGYGVGGISGSTVYVPTDNLSSTTKDAAAGVATAASAAVDGAANLSGGLLGGLLGGISLQTWLIIGGVAYLYLKVL